MFKISCKILLCICLATIAVFANAQTIKNITNKDTLYHIYSLNNEQLLYINSNPKNMDTAWLFTNSYKKLNIPFVAAIDSMKPGTYLQASIYNNMVSYVVVDKTPFTISAKKIDDDLLIFFKNKDAANPTNQNIIANAKIYFAGQLIPYDSGYGAYVTNLKILQNKEIKNKFIAITYLEKNYLQELVITPEPKPSRGRKINTPKSTHAYGYSITDKPIYKLKDSLHFKAYLVDNVKGNPITSKATIKVIDALQNKIIFTKVVKPISAGAYILDWQLPDTLLQDRSYRISIGYISGATFVSRVTNFKVESYILNKNLISVAPSKTQYRAGEAIKIKVNTSDANGFALADVRLQYTISLHNISAIDKDSLLITKQMQENFISIDTVLPYEKMHEFIIDYKKLPKATMVLNCKGTCIDAQFEKMEFNFNITYTPLQHEVKFYQAKDSLFVKKLFLTKDTAQKYILKCYDAVNKLVDSLPIVTPFAYKLKSQITKATLHEAEKLIASTTIFYNVLQVMQVDGQRSNDKIKISFKYPFEQGIHYRIKKGKTLIKSAYAKNLNFELADNTLEEYSILLSHNLNAGIENNFYKLTFYPLSKLVNIQSTIPDDAFPGQTIPIEFTVTDWYGKPVKNFNMATYAVNSMFQQNLSEPFVDIPDSFKRSLQTQNIAGTYNFLQFKPLSTISSHYITKQHVVRYNLLKNEFYQLLYGKQGYAFIKNAKQKATSELAIMVTYKGVLYSPKYCMVDSNLLTVGKINNINYYSFVCDSGKHNIFVRAFNRYISIANVQISSFNKHYISINLDSITANVKPNFVSFSDTISMATPTAYETQKIEKSLLFFYGLNVDSCLQFTNSALAKKQFTYYSNRFESIAVDDDQINVIAPINFTDALITNRFANYSLKTGRVVHYYDYSSRTFTSKVMDKKTVIDIPFQEQVITYNLLPYLLEPDTIVTKPIVEQDYVSENNNDMEKTINLNKYNYNSPRHTESYFQIKIFEGLTKQITTCWVINNDAIEQSTFISSIPYNGNIVTSYNGNSPVDIYFIGNNQTIRIIKNITIPAFATLYINADSLAMDTLKEENVAKAIEIYNTITRVPEVPFYYNPTESNSLVLENNSYANTSGNAYLKGTVLNSSLQTLVQTYIILEQGGKYKAGAITNNNGEFEFLKLAPGIYDIKIYNLNYTIKFYYQIQIGGKYGQYFTTILEPRNGQLPDFESINNNYRLTTYEQKEKSKIIVNVYDYKTKQLITDSKMQWFITGQSENIEFKNELNYTNIGKPYILKISKAGYKTFDLSNIYFDLQNKTIVDVFLNTQNANGAIIEYFSLNTVANYNDYTNVNIEPKTIIGRVTYENGYTVEGATIKVFNGNSLVGGDKTDANGMYKIKPLDAGIYRVKVNCLGYATQEVANVKITAQSGAVVNFKLEKSADKSLSSVMIKSKKVNRPQMIDQNRAGSASPSPPQSSALNSKQVEKLSTNTVLSAASLRPGVYQEKEGGPITLGGGRANNTTFMIDGVMVRDVTRTKQLAGGIGELDRLDDNLESNEEGYLNLNASGDVRSKNKESEKMNSLFNNIIDAGMGNQFRKTFNDVAYWQPNLISDANGKTYCTIKLPDNITQWQTYTIGMGKAFAYGTNNGILKVYKPMQTITYAPSFLHKGDSLYVKAKFTNLLAEAKMCELFFNVNGKSVKNFTSNLVKQTSDSVQIFASNLEPLQFSAGLKYLDKYTDAETITIPVQSTAVTLYNNQSIYAEADSTYYLNFDAGTKGTVIFNNVIYERILHYIQDLENYEYGCVEQTASKLKALVYKEKIYKSLQRKINVQTAIIACVNKLQDMQNANGSFGWWRKGTGDLRMTTYAFDALALASQHGYSSNAMQSASSFLNSEIKKLKGASVLYPMYLLQKYGFLNVDNLDRKTIDETNLNITDKIYFYKILQQRGDSISSMDWYSLMLELQNNARIRYCDNFFYDPRANIFNGYTIFKGTALETEFAQKFRTKITNGHLGSNLNTFSKAALIEALLSDAQNNNNPVLSNVVINDTLKVKTYPYTYTIANSSVKIKHSGAPVWVNTAEAYETENPIIHDSIFKINTAFIQNGSNSASLQRGVTTQLQINIMTYKTKDYVMIEVPLPAGIIIKNKPALPNTQDYIEYKTDKILIYKTNMPIGNTSFTIDVQPIYTGVFNMPPAQIGMMYYPFVFGNNVKSVVPIK